MGLFVPSEQIPNGVMDMGSTSFATRIVYGEAASLMIAERPPNYHSRPHTHDCEQLNILDHGELHIFTEDASYHLLPGDALRIQPNVLHWSWNKGYGPCVLVEVHSPGIQSDPRLAEFAVALLDGDERVTGARPVNYFPEVSEEFITRIESMVPERAGRTQRP